MKWSALTIPPPRRLPPPKHPLFTRDFFSTKSFGPGHVVGAGILVLGLVGLTKLFVARGQEEAGRSREPARPRWPVDAAKLAQTDNAQTDNARGEYGQKP
jgi:hypothetical protein